MAEDAEFVDLTLGIQADIFIDLAAEFARVNHFAATETIRTIEEKIVRDLTVRAIDLGARNAESPHRDNTCLTALVAGELSGPSRKCLLE